MLKRVFVFENSLTKFFVHPQDIFFSTFHIKYICIYFFGKCLVTKYSLVSIFIFLVNFIFHSCTCFKTLNLKKIFVIFTLEVKQKKKGGKIGLIKNHGNLITHFKNKFLFYYYFFSYIIHQFGFKAEKLYSDHSY